MGKKHRARGAAKRALLDGTTVGLSNGPSSATRHLWGPWQVMTRDEARDEARARTGMEPLLVDWVERVWINKRYLVMTAQRPGGVLQLLVQRTDGRAKRNWQDLQQIKNDVAGHGALAVEVFPPEADVVDGAHVTHLWVMPEGFYLPVRREWV